MKKLRRCIAKGTLVIPKWPSASFRTFLRNRPSRSAPFVKDFVALPKLLDFSVVRVNDWFTRRNRHAFFRMLALRFYLSRATS